MIRTGDQAGFTLLELMTTILIAAVLILIAVPGMQSLSQRSQQLNAVGDMSSMLSRARSEASSRYRAVTICSSTDRSTCSAAPAWQSGWIMFVDDSCTAINATPPLPNKTRSACEELIQIGGPIPAADTLAVYDPANNAVGAMTFTAGGLPDVGGYTLRYCSYSGAVGTMKPVVINASGQVRYASDGKNSANLAIPGC